MDWHTVLVFIGVTILTILALAALIFIGAIIGGVVGSVVGGILVPSYVFRAFLERGGGNNDN